MWLVSCLLFAWLPYIYNGSSLSLTTALFTFEFARLHVARVLSIDRLVCLPVILARALFTLGQDGLHAARVLSTCGLVALHLACVIFIWGYGIV